MLAVQQNKALEAAAACSSYLMDMAELERALGATLLQKGAGRGELGKAYLSGAVIQSEKLIHCMVLDAHGRVVAADAPYLTTLKSTMHDLAKRIFDGEDIAVGCGVDSGMPGGNIFCVASAVKDGKGRLCGVVVGVSCEDIIDTMLSRNLSEGIPGLAFIDGEGKAILSRGIAKSAPWGSIRRVSDLHHASRGSKFRLPDGTTAIGSLIPVPNTEWAALTLLPERHLFSIHRRYICILLGMVFLTASITAALASRIGAKLARPVRRLSRTAREFGNGNFDARADVKTGDELEVLAQSFNQMAQDLKERTDALHITLSAERRLAERASSLYSVAQGIIVHADLNKRLKIIAKALASECGVKRCAIMLKRGCKLVLAAGYGLADSQQFDSLVIDSSYLLQFEKAKAPAILTFNADSHHMPRTLALHLGLERFAALPLIYRKHPVGLAILDNPGNNLHLDKDTVESATEMASLAAAAIENAEAFEKWMNIGQSLQKNMLPSVPESVGKFSLASAYFAALEVSDLGGDFYDIINLPDGRIGLVTADVSGKGLEAAVFTAMGKYTLRAYSYEDSDPSVILKRTNNALVDIGSDLGFVTMFFGILDPDTGRLVYANAGHPPGLVANADGSIRWLSDAGPAPPLGIFMDKEYPSAECTLHDGDVLICYTDGVIEARRNRRPFETERLAEVVSRARIHPPEKIAQVVHSAVCGYCGGRIQDDIALLVVKRDEGTQGEQKLAKS